MFSRACLLGVIACAGLALAATTANAADPLYDSTPMAQQRPAVDGINFKFGVETGVFDSYANHMFLTSISTPMPYFQQFGAQLDLGIGSYRSDYISAAAGLHLFWRDPAVGMLGIYGDWGYVNPEHAGRVGIEGSLYNGNWTLDFLVGPQFGQHVNTRGVGEVDLTYYFNDNFKASLGYRLISRGSVGNVAFEYMPEIGAYNGWSLYGEAEAGEDDYYAARIGLRYSFGAASATNLMARDREAGVQVRIPRNLASVTQCGDLAVPRPKTWWRAEMSNLCGSKDEIADHGGTILKK